MGQLGDISPEASIAIGIVVGLLSTSIQSLGLTLQRQSHLLEDQKLDPETRKPPYKRPRWQLGMSMFVISNLVGSTIQITTLPLPVLSTLQASGLVFNTAFATLLLKEPFTRYSLFGTILTCAGAALIAVFGAVAEPAHNLGQLLELLKEKGFIVWMVGTMLVAGATIVLTYVLKVLSSYQHMSKHIQKNERPRSSSKAGVPIQSRPRRQSFTAQLPRPLQLKVTRLRMIRGLSFALISGILSAHSLLVAKSAVELIVRTIIDHDNQFNRFQSWLILLALLFFALSQLYYLHLGLRLCSTSVLYPFVFCIYNIVAILDGLIYFRQASRLTLLHGVLVAIGTVILLSGVLALSWRLDDTTPTEAAPQLTAPHTPLTPGMSIWRVSDELERSPIAQPPSRSSSEPFPRVDEHTPLLSRPGRRMTLTHSTMSPGGAAAREVWAELEDEEDTYDFLASLPRSASPSLQNKPQLHIPKRSRRSSLPTKDRINSAPAASSTQQKRRQTLHEYSQSQAEDAAAKLQSPVHETFNTSMNEHHQSNNTSSTTRESSNMLTVEPQESNTATSTLRKVSRERKGMVRFDSANINETSPKRSRQDREGSGKRDERKSKPG